jgi:phosphoribosylanthranilate isomerase
MPIDVKICGINSLDALTAAAAPLNGGHSGGGAKMLGFVFFPKSPRAVTLEEARALLAHVPQGVQKVALMVNPDDFEAQSIGAQLPFDWVQLHGNESPERVAEIRALTGRPVMKAVGISGPDDIKRAHAYEAVAERILLDAKAPEGAVLPGGNALSFDWQLISGETWEKPWLLAGGLNADNLAQAVKISKATFVDVSSGVEDEPGRKSAQKIKEFLQLAATL